MAAASAATTSEREIAATRVFDAPRELVWRMWTDPRPVIHWWGPNGFTKTIPKMDVRPGGGGNFIMHGPDGRDYTNKAVYREVTKPSRLTYSHISGPLFEAEIDFIGPGKKPEVRRRITVEWAERRTRVAREFAAGEGMPQTMDKLQATLRRSLVI